MPEAPELLAYGATLTVTAPDGIPGADWQEAVKNFFNLLAKIFQGEAGVTIGHLKGFLRLGNGGYGYFSTVGSAAGTTARFTEGSPSSRSELDFNVLVFGIAENKALPLIEVAAASLAGELGAVCTLEKAKKKTIGGFIKKKKTEA
jgi:hypothetical protein